MAWIPAAEPELLVAHSHETRMESDGTWGYRPVYMYDKANDWCEMHYLGYTHWATSNNVNTPIQGSAINLSSDVIGILEIDGIAAAGLNVALFSIATMRTNGAAYSAGAADFAAAIKTTHYAKTTPLTATGTTYDRVFLLPYTSTQCVLVAHNHVWIINLSDASIASDFAIDTDNASYTQFERFTASGGAENSPCPQIDGDGNLICFFYSAINTSAVDTTVYAFVKINLATGTTTHSNYGGVAAQILNLTIMPDGTFYAIVDGATMYHVSADLATITALTGPTSSTGVCFGPAVAQDEFWNIVSVPSGTNYYPAEITVSGTTATATAKTAGGVNTKADANFNCPVISIVDANTYFLVRSAFAVSDAYVGIYNMSDGGIATGYTQVVMSDHYGTTDFPEGFRRKTDRSMAQPTLYTQRVLLELMGEPAVVGTPSNVSANVVGPTQFVPSWDYATVPDDTLDYFLISVQQTDTVDWVTGTTTYNPASIAASYTGDMILTALTGTIYIAVRAVGTGGQTFDSATVAVDLTGYGPDIPALVRTVGLNNVVGKWATHLEVSALGAATPAAKLNGVYLPTVNNLIAGTNVTLDKSGADVTINASGGGGGGGGNISGAYDIEAGTYTDAGLSEEFESGTLNANWTVVVGGSGTADPIGTVTTPVYDLTTRDKGMLLQTGNTAWNGSPSGYFQMRAATIATGHELIVSLSTPDIAVTTTSAYMPRLALTTSTGVFSGTRSELYVDGSAGSSIGTYFGSSTVRVAAAGAVGRRIYMRVVRNNDDYHFFYSSDGTIWSACGAHSNSAAAYIWLLIGSNAAWTRQNTGDPIACINWIRHVAYTGLDPW